MLFSLEPSSLLPLPSHALSGPCRGVIQRRRSAGLGRIFGGPLIPTLLCVPSSHLHQLQDLDIHINKDSENLFILKEKALAG